MNTFVLVLAVAAAVSVATTASVDTRRARRGEQRALPAPGTDTLRELESAPPAATILAPTRVGSVPPLYSVFASLPSDDIVATVNSNYPAPPYSAAGTVDPALSNWARSYLPPVVSSSPADGSSAPPKAEPGSPLIWVPGAGVLSVRHVVNVNKVVSVQRAADEPADHSKLNVDKNINNSVGNGGEYTGANKRPGDNKKPGENNKPGDNKGDNPAGNNGNKEPWRTDNGKPNAINNGGQPAGGKDGQLTAQDSNERGTYKWDPAWKNYNWDSRYNKSYNWDSSPKNGTPDKDGNKWDSGSKNGAPATNSLNPDKAGANPDKAGANPDKASATPDKAGANPDKAGATPAQNDKESNWSKNDSAPLLIFAPGAGVVAVRHVVNVNKVVWVRRGAGDLLPAGPGDQLLAVNGDQIAAINGGQLVANNGGQIRAVQPAQLVSNAGLPLTAVKV